MSNILDVKCYSVNRVWGLSITATVIGLPNVHTLYVSSVKEDHTIVGILENIHGSRDVQAKVVWIHPNMLLTIDELCESLRVEICMRAL